MKVLPVARLNAMLAILLRARAHITKQDTCVHDGLCWAIVRCGVYAKYNDRDMMSLTYLRAADPDVGYLVDWVESMLGRKNEYGDCINTWLGDWVRNNHPRLFVGRTPDERNELAKQARLNWITWMIDELKKELA